MGICNFHLETFFTDIHRNMIFAKHFFSLITKIPFSFQTFTDAIMATGAGLFESKYIYYLLYKMKDMDMNSLRLLYEHKFEIHDIELEL